MPHMMSKESTHRLAEARRLMRPSGRTKVASGLGGDGKDTQFEQAFSNLAHAFLKDKAPSLLDYEVGFQLMERNDDNTKAVGIFGFKVGQQWLYAPCFFLSGDLKGHELLYIKNQDQFVPLKENWLNHLLQKRPNILGKDVEPNLSRLGVMSPELSAFSRSPSKFASHVKVAGASVPTELVPGMAAFAHFGRTSPFTDPKYKDMIDVPTFLKKEGQAVITSLIRDLMAFPKLASAFEKFYGGLGCIQEAIKEAKAREARLGNILEKEGLRRLEFGQMSPDQRGQAPTQANGGVLSSGHDAFESVAGYIQRPTWDRSRDQFYKTAFKDPTSPLSLDVPKPPIAPTPKPLGPGAPPPAAGAGGMTGGVSSGAPQVQPGQSPAQMVPSDPATNAYGQGGNGMTGGVGSGAPSIEEAGMAPPPPPRGSRFGAVGRFVGHGMDRANTWLDSNAKWLPSKLPGGRATSAMLGVGGIAGLMAMMAARRRKKTRDERLASMMAKESGSAQYKRPREDAPFASLVGLPNTEKKPRKGVLTDMADATPTGSSMVEKKGALAIITNETVANSGVLESISDEEKSKVKLEGVAFRDERPENSIAYEVTGPLKLSTPHETGIYHVLTQPGTFEKCLVVLGPQGAKGAADFATVFALAGDKKWLNIHPANLWCKSDEVSSEAYRKWLDGLEKPGSLKPSYSAVYMLVGPNGDCTLPFEVRKAVGGDEAVDTYEVTFRDWASKSRPGNLPPISSPYSDSMGCCGPGGYDQLHITNKEGGRIRTMGNAVYVPGDYKIVTLKADNDKEDDRPRPYYMDSSDPQPLNPGTMVDVTKAIYEKTAELRINHGGTVVEVNGYPMDHAYVVGHLVRDWAITEKQARELVKLARDARRFKCRVKLASGLPDDPTAYHVAWLRDVEAFLKEAAPGDPMDPMMAGMTSAPPFPEPPTGSEQTLNGSVPAQYPQSETLPVMSTEPAQNNQAAYDPRTPPDPQTMQTGMQAAQTGQKEVFDTAMVGSLLKAVRDDTMVDRHLGDLMKGLDRIGRILFSFYWHGEEFQERYGKKDMPELEDSLRNAFEQLGDVVLFLKQKTVEPFPEEAAGADLGSTAQV